MLVLENSLLWGTFTCIADVQSYSSSLPSRCSSLLTYIAMATKYVFGCYLSPGREGKHQSSWGPLWTPSKWQGLSLISSSSLVIRESTSDCMSVNASETKRMRLQRNRHSLRSQETFEEVKEGWNTNNLLFIYYLLPAIDFPWIGSTGRES